MAISIWSVVLFGVLSVAVPCMAVDVYIWTDREGVTHIEDQAPKILPGERIRVEKHTFATESDDAAADAPEAQSFTLPPQTGDAGATSLKDAERKERERLRQEALEKARRNYEEAKASERRYLNKYKSADNAKARHYWRGKLRDLEEKRLQLEELEKSEETD